MEIITTENAPKALGPYSQAIKAGGFIWCSGLIPIDPAANAVTATTVEGQTRQAITNLKNVLEEGGFKMSDAVKVTCYLQDLANFGALNEVYAKFFSEPYPARVAYQVAALPKGAMVEVDIIAVK